MKLTFEDRIGVMKIFFAQIGPDSAATFAANLQDSLNRLAKNSDDFAEHFRKMYADNARINADNERLRGLVKQAEYGDDGYICPWCKAGKHTPTCPAFTPDGDVR